jgi:hypothetical protein
LPIATERPGLEPYVGLYFSSSPISGKGRTDLFFGFGLTVFIPFIPFIPVHPRPIPRWGLPEAGYWTSLTSSPTSPAEVPLALPNRRAWILALPKQEAIAQFVGDPVATADDEAGEWILDGHGAPHPQSAGAHEEDSAGDGRG